MAQAPTETRTRQCCAEFLQHMDVVLVGAAAFDEPDIDQAIEFLLIVQRRLVEIDEIDQLDDALVDVEQATCGIRSNRRASKSPILASPCDPPPVCSL